MRRIIEWLFGRQPTRERTAEEKRADYWAAVVWPATWNRISELSRRGHR